MPKTIECGEGRHDDCRGTGKYAWLLPQLDVEAGFACGCDCHHEPGARVPCPECLPRRKKDD